MLLWALQSDTSRSALPRVQGDAFWSDEGISCPRGAHPNAGECASPLSASRCARLALSALFPLPFPVQGISYEAFLKLLEYIYTDDVGELSHDVALDLIVLSES